MARQGEVSIIIRVRDASQAAITSVNNRLTKFGASVGSMLRVVTGAAAAAGLAVGGVGAALLPFIIRSTMEFQKFSAQLRIFTGSAAAASRTMDDLKRLAMELPFDLANITEAFITLRSGGIDPSEETIRRLGDIASGMGKDIGQLAQAVKNGLMGEMEMLKQFGVSMLVQGDSLRASFGSTTKLIGRDAASILGFMEEIARKEFTGASAARMETLEGAFSNLQDKAWNLAVVLGEKGGVAEAIAEMAGDMSDLADAAERNEAIIVKWSRVTVDAIQLIGSLIWSALVIPFDAVVGVIAGTIAGMLKLGAIAVGVLNNIAKAVHFVTGETTLTQGLVDITDPSKMNQFSDTAGAFAMRRFRGGANQVGNLAGRGADLAFSFTDPITPGSVGGRGLAGTTRTPDNGKGAGTESAADVLARERKVLKAQMDREEKERAARAKTQDAFNEPGTLNRIVDKGAGVDALAASAVPALAGPDMAEMNASIAVTLESLKTLEVQGPTAMQQFGASIMTVTDGALTLEQQLISIGTTGVQTFMSGFIGAFAQIREGWGAVGDAMIGAVRGAVAQMAADQAQYYGLKAMAALGEAFLNPLSAGKSLAAAAKFTAAAAGFAALSGLVASAGSGGGGGGASGGRGGSGGNRGNTLDDVERGMVLVNLPDSGIINVNDPRTQDEFRAMLEKLSGRNVEIRRR
jgi:hypothetical protein